MPDYLKYPLLILLWVIALMSGAMSVFRGLYGIYSGVIPSRSLFWSCAWIAFVIAAGILWFIEHRERTKSEKKLRETLESRSPKLALLLETLIHAYDESTDATIFILSAYLRNAGEATVASGWRAQYIVGGAVEPMTLLYLRGPYSVSIKDETLNLTTNDLLQSQVLTKRLERGDAKAGRLLFSLKGNRSAQVASCQYKIVVGCCDFEDTLVTASFVPHPAHWNRCKCIRVSRSARLRRRPYKVHSAC